MAKLIVSGNELNFTILPYTYDTPIQGELTTRSSDYVLGYVSRNKKTDKYTFTYTESGSLTEVDNHWSLDILKEFPYCEQDGTWIIYNCSPEKTTLEFGKIIDKYHHSLHIHNWDTWSVVGKEGKVVVITSWETY